MTDQQSNLKRAARRLRLWTVVAAVGIGGTMLVAIGAVLAGRQEGVPGMQIRGALHPWTIILSVAVIGSCVMLALSRLMAMVARAEAGDPFGVAADLRGFAVWLFLSVLGLLFAPALIQLAIRLVTGERLPITVEISVAEALMLVLAALLFFVARLLDQAESVAREAREII